MRTLRFASTAGLAALLLVGCATSRGPRHQIELPDRAGVPIGVLEFEVPASALREGETAHFDVEFEVDMRGRVQESHMTSSSHPDMDTKILADHKQWIYAVSSRAKPCTAERFVGTQAIEFTRRDGKLAMKLEPARVDRTLEEVSAENVASFALKPESMRTPAYPRAAALDGVYGTIGVIIEFGPDGKVRSAFPLNGSGDRWGLTRTVMETVSRYELKNPPGRTVLVCQPFVFTLE
jgi:outer membrane biosynthesis protein TonB